MNSGFSTLTAGMKVRGADAHRVGDISLLRVRVQGNTSSAE